MMEDVSGQNNTEKTAPQSTEEKVENMDDSGFVTCSSVPNLAEDSKSLPGTSGDTHKQQNNDSDLDNATSISKDKIAAIKLDSGDNEDIGDELIEPNLWPLLKAARNSPQRNDEKMKGTLVKQLQEDLSESSDKPEVEIVQSKPSTSQAKPSLFKKRKCKIKSKRRSREEATSSDNQEVKDLDTNKNSPNNAKKQKTGSSSLDSDSDEFVDANDVLETNDSKSFSSRVDDSSNKSSSSSLSSESDTEAKEEKRKLTRAEKAAEEEAWLLKDLKDLPLPKWQAVREVRRRQSSPWTNYWPYKACGCHAMVKRFQLYKALKKHEGCVNALHFNQTGTMIASGSDDLKIVLWDWTANSNQPVIAFDSGHKSNVFQAKFLPECGDATIVSSARDGQVRVANISTTGTCHGTKKIAQHKGSAHKLALDVDSKSTFLSCGEDGVVFGLDLRLDKPASKLATVSSGSRKIPLYSIHVNPARPHEFAVSGRNSHAHVFDRRMLSTPGNDKTTAVKTYCPQHLQDVSDVKANITCLVYNWDGTELLCSYNDEDIYLFDTSHSDGADYVRRYKGHRNNATVKGVNFYGPRSEFVVSGSDCGNIFFWEKDSARVVQLMEGDQGGVVNVLEPHPNLPVIATSGLDPEVKIWTPTADPNANNNPLIRQFMLSNKREREEEQQSMPDMIDGHMLWFLMRTLRNRSRRRRAEESREGNDASSSERDDDDSIYDTSSSSSSSEEDDYHEPRCIQS